MTTSKNVYSVIVYLTIILLLETLAIFFLLNNPTQEFFIKFHFILICVLISGIAGVLYCFRGVYLNYSVKKIWGQEWIPWYIVRPMTSLISGLVGYIFLKAGLLILDAKTGANSSHWGFYSLAFIAGLNVDKFINKIEELAHATWGIPKSRASSIQN